MPYTVLVHLTNADPMLAEIDQLPDPQDQFLVCSNPRQRDGKDLHYILPEVNTILLPWHRISFVEVLPTEEEEEVITFIRE
ncbi:MAG: hypothetical protein D6759_19595 [Chloroflexi bacterium]|nr:MAG: hypothetical protein D6759_19595 [Chloroflexota bacterium]